MKPIKLGKKYDDCCNPVSPSGKSDVYFPSVSFDPKGVDVPDDTFLVTFRARKNRETEDFKKGNTSVDAELLEITNIENEADDEPAKNSDVGDELDKLRDDAMGKSKKSEASASDDEYVAE